MLKRVVVFLVVLGVGFRLSWYCLTVLWGVGLISSGSMDNTLLKDDTIVYSKHEYTKADPERGDIVVFNLEGVEQLVSKRVIGMPGDSVELIEGVVYINGDRLEEPYISSATLDTTKNMEFKVPMGKYFLLGDNRGNSFDSRYWENPYIDREEIVGRVFFRYGSYPQFVE